MSKWKHGYKQLYTYIHIYTYVSFLIDRIYGGYYTTESKRSLLPGITNIEQVLKIIHSNVISYAPILTSNKNQAFCGKRYIGQLSAQSTVTFSTPPRCIVVFHGCIVHPGIV